MISAGQNKAFSTNKTLNLGGRLFDLNKPLVMGILNVTPDSFFDGGKFTDDSSILRQAEKMLSDGAAVIDVGGYSSRPGADDVPVEEEIRRTANAIKLIRKEFSTCILSVDTFRAAVAQRAHDEGANMVNDISGGELDPRMFATLANLRVPYICMHMRGTPQTMASLAAYENLVKEVLDFFHRKIAALHTLGVQDIIIDPGFGFAKTAAQNFELLGKLELLKITGKPLCVGLSRKSMIWRTLNTTPEAALNGTTALHMTALLKGASILRVHDVKEAKEVIELFLNLQNSSEWGV